MLAAWSAGAEAVRAQTPQDRTPGGAVTGTVVSAATGQPIPNAVIVLESSSDAALVTQASGAFASRSLLAVTDVSGAYRFAALPAGHYRLVVRHLGFRPAIVDVDLAQSVPFRVSVGLVVNPIRLDAVDARATTLEPYGRLRTASDEQKFGRLDAEQYRDQHFLEGDAAVLTHADVMEAVTLGETDLFRAVQRLPGVTTRDDFTAALWTRGAPWSQTRVYFDGLPLFNPVHAVGVFAGLNGDAVGAASFHPGVRSSAIAEGAAGVLNVSSRRPTRHGFGAMGELSMISGHASGDWVSNDGRVAAMVAARRSWVDFATRMAEAFGADSGTYIPYAFYDVTARLDADLGRGFGLEASALWEEDDVHGDVTDLLQSTQGYWGNRLGRVSLVAPLGSLRIRTTAGVSSFAGRIGPDSAGLTLPGQGPAPQHQPTRNALRVVTLSADLAPPSAGARPSWALGVQAQLHDQHYDGQYPRPYPDVVLPTPLVMNDNLPVVSLWGEGRLPLGRHAAVEAGLRVEGHRPVLNSGGVGLAPKLSFRATPSGTRLTFTAAAARSFQYTQALAPAGPSVGPDLYLTDVWFLAGDTIPAMRSDIVTTGIEAWLGLGWTASLNLFARSATGMAVPEPAPGTLNDQRPIFVSAKNRARGVELSARRLVGRWTMSAAYSFGVSDLRAPSGYAFNPTMYDFPSIADRRHVLDLTSMVRVSNEVRTGAAFTIATGSPFSRFILGQTTGCDTTPGCVDTVATSIEMPNGARAPAYAALDLLLDWSKTLRSGVRFGAYLQLRNVLNRANAVTYTGSVDQCTTPNPPTLVPVEGPGRYQLCDRFDKGVPFMPLAGIRVAF